MDQLNEASDNSVRGGVAGKGVPNDGTGMADRTDR
jgi:hypothetical protein